MDAALAALFGATIGGILSVVASWLAQRVQTKEHWFSQEVLRRQQLYSEFVEGAARCYGDAMLNNEPDVGRLARIYGEIGRMRLQSSEKVVEEAYQIADRILNAYREPNRTRVEIRDLLANHSVDLFSDFGEACRAELRLLQPHRVPDGSSSTWRFSITRENQRQEVA